MDLEIRIWWDIEIIEEFWFINLMYIYLRRLINVLILMGLKFWEEYGVGFLKDKKLFLKLVW